MSDRGAPASRESNRRPRFPELAIVAAISLAGLGLRAAYPSRMAVEHFDEGVYASNVFFDDGRSGGRYPDQHLYAPPLLPFLIELSMVAFGPSNLAAMLVSVVAGSLTVPLAWWSGRRWFGPVSGIVSATLVAFSDVHIFFSRAALTDVLLCFWLLAAVYLFWEALTGRSRLALVAGGIATGLAWWTKYSGWLPLAIGLAGLVPWCLFGRIGPPSAVAPASSIRGRLRFMATASWKWIFVAALAALVWAPWLWSLQSKGGYAAVHANHRGYLLGLSRWFEGLCAQAAKLNLLDGWLSAHAPALAFLAALVYLRLSTRRSTWNMLFENRFAIAIAPATCGLCLLASSGVVLGGVAVLGILWATVRRASTVESSGASLGAWLVAVWFAGLFVSTPLYLPYPRLTLPWLMATWMGGGLFVQAIVLRQKSPEAEAAGTSEGQRASVAQSSKAAVFAALLVAAVAIAGLERPALARGVPAWQTRTGVAEIVPKILIDIAADTKGAPVDGIVIYTYSEPALLFQLRLAGARWVQPVKDMRFAGQEALPPRLPTFVAYGEQARQTPGFPEQLVSARDRLRTVGLAKFTCSLLVRLDAPALSRPALGQGYVEVDRLK